MDDLLPYYERELNLAHRFTKEFSEQYPKVAARLGLAGEHIEDPQIEQLIQTFAFIAASISQKLDDDYPEFTEAFLQANHIHYLRPTPSCSIAQFEYPDREASALTKEQTIQVNTSLNSLAAMHGVSCTFSTVYPVHLSPLHIASAYYDSILSTSGKQVHGRIVPQASRAINLQLDVSRLEKQALSTLSCPHIRVFIDAPQPLASLIRQAILHHTVQVFLESGDQWYLASKALIQPVGLLAEEPLFHYGEQTPLFARLLAEFFAFPEKFNFFDIAVAELRKIPPSPDGQITLRFVLPRLADDQDDERWFEQIDTQHFKLHCSPVINLFETQAHMDSKKNPTNASYPLLVDGNSPQAYAIHDVLSIAQVQGDKESLIPLSCLPLHAKFKQTEKTQLFWLLHADEFAREAQPGHEYYITLLDQEAKPNAEMQESLSIKVLATNRDFPFNMPYGQPTGDLFQTPESTTQTNIQDWVIRLLRRPTKPIRFYRGRDAHWKYISHLHLNEFALEHQGAEAIKEVLRIYESNSSGTIKKMTEGIVDLQLCSGTAMRAMQSQPMIFMGVQVKMYIDPDLFVGTDVYVVAQIFELYVTELARRNGFSQLIVLNAHTKAEIFRGEPRFEGDV